MFNESLKRRGGINSPAHLPTHRRLVFSRLQRAALERLWLDEGNCSLTKSRFARDDHALKTAETHPYILVSRDERRQSTSFPPWMHCMLRCFCSAAIWLPTRTALFIFFSAMVNYIISYINPHTMQIAGGGDDNLSNTFHWWTEEWQHWPQIIFVGLFSLPDMGWIREHQQFLLPFPFLLKFSGIPTDVHTYIFKQ